MSFSDYSSLQTSVGNWMARSDLSGDIPDFIALFETEANRKLRVRQMEITQPTTPSSGSFPLPTDYLAWRNLSWSSGGLTKSLEYVEPSELSDLYPDTPAANPRVFAVLGTTDSVGMVQLMPTDNSVVQFTYFQKIPGLSASNTSNWLLAAHPDVYLAGSLVEANVFTKDYDTAALWKARRDTLLDEIVSLDQKTRGPSRIRVTGRTP